ncbi:MAG TPA: DUF1810 domain-containing protein [Caldimonas sp.]|nr:DUF1810 domain-containing protein [Caldimonas sp.]
MDPFRLQRFVDAQNPVYARVRNELAAGEKRGHWMWFVFPQLAMLGQSETSRQYGIVSRAEAEAYMRHPVLGSRLIECTRLVLGHRGKTVRDIFGTPDDLKFRSSMTLFNTVAPSEPAFADALARLLEGKPDPRTLLWLAPGGPPQR